jgi:HrpE protein.
MNVYELLDYMEETLEDASTLPFTGGKSMVDTDRVKDIVDDIRLNLPQQMRQAEAIVADRKSILEEANREAEMIIQKAEERARSLVREEEIVKQAQKRALELLSTAQGQAKEMRNNVTSYCENMLRKTEEVLAKNTQEVRTVHATLRKTAKKE